MVFEWLKRIRTSRQAPEVEGPSPDQVVLGYGVTFRNEEFDVDLDGIPLEIMEEMERRGLDIDEVAQRRLTHIAVRPMWVGLNLEFHGSPWAQAVLALMGALTKDDLSEAEGILTDNPDMLTADHDGAGVPMVGAVWHGANEAVRFLLAHGDLPSRPTAYGTTPLHWAAGRGHGETVDLLLAAGADAESLSCFLLTPTEVAGINGHNALTKRLRTDLQAPDSSVVWPTLLRRMGIAVPTDG